MGLCGARGTIVLCAHTETCLSSNNPLGCRGEALPERTPLLHWSECVHWECSRVAAAVRR
jgi:hypothetical protein